MVGGTGGFIYVWVKTKLVLQMFLHMCSSKTLQEDDVERFSLK